MSNGMCSKQASSARSHAECPRVGARNTRSWLVAECCRPRLTRRHHRCDVHPHTCTAARRNCNYARVDTTRVAACACARSCDWADHDRDVPKGYRRGLMADIAFPELDHWIRV